MNGILVYMVKAAVYTTGFFLVYRFFLSRDTLYRRNRSYILLTVVASMILPLVTLETSKPVTIPFFGKVLSEILVSGNSGNGLGTTSGLAQFFSLKWSLFIYFSGVAFFALKLIFDLTELLILIRLHRTKGNHIIRFNGLNTSGFSAFGYVFLNNKLNNDEAEEVIKHESNHLHHNHSLDILFLELMMVVQWFNPFVHLFGRALRAVHEYQADEECISKGTPVNKYQKLLFNQIFKTQVFTITNSFSNPSLIKKRMIMMTRQRSKSFVNFKLLLIIPVVFSFLLVFSKCSGQKQTPENQIDDMLVSPPPPPPVPDSKSNYPISDILNEEDTEPLTSVEVFPKFPGGEIALMQFIARSTSYPEQAKMKGIQGKVIVRFAVDEKGNVTRESILKGVDPGLDAEALRVVRTLPAFEPGRQGGKPVPVWYMVPINFVLR